MLHTKFHGNQSTGSRKEDFLRVFTIYGRGGHLGHDPDAANKLSFPLSKEAPHKIWHTKRFRRRRCLSIVDGDNGRTTTDGRRTIGIP